MLIPKFDFVKVGDCPNNKDAITMVCGNLCDGDESCPGSQKCVNF